MLRPEATAVALPDMGQNSLPVSAPRSAETIRQELKQPCLESMLTVPVSDVVTGREFSRVFVAEGNGADAWVDRYAHQPVRPGTLRKAIPPDLDFVRGRHGGLEP